MNGTICRKGKKTQDKNTINDNEIKDGNIRDASWNYQNKGKITQDENNLKDNIKYRRTSQEQHIYKERR